MSIWSCSIWSFGHAAARSLVGRLGALLLAAAAGAAVADAPLSSTELKQLSLEDLMNIQVTSVSRRAEKLSTTPSAIQVITAEDIRRSGATSIPEALRLADNLDVAQENAHDWAISARGFNTALANKLLVLIDGRTVYTPLFSGVLWDRQDYLLEDIDRIEVISGPGGTLWGENAVNGVINIITKHPKDTQGLYAEAGGGTELEDFAGVRYGGQAASDTYLRVYAKYFDRGNEKLADGASGDDSWNMGQGGFRLEADPTARDALDLQGDAYSGRENTGFGAAGASGGNILGRWSHSGPDGAESSLQIYYDHTRVSQPESAAMVNGVELAPAGILRDDLDTYDIDFQHHFRWGSSQNFVCGLGYRLTDDEEQNAPSVGVFPLTLYQRLYSGFIQDEIALRRDLVFTLGTKLEHNSYTGYEMEPSARLQWSFTERQTLWAAISRAVRAPSRLERDLEEPVPTKTVPLILAGSSNFRSETLVAYELGYRAQFGSRFTGSLALFYNDYDHVRSVGITPVTLFPLVFQNNLRGENHGLELSADYQVLDWWRLHGGYTALNDDIKLRPGAFDLNGGLNETADPAQRLSLRSLMDVTERLQLDMNLRWVDGRKINSGPQFRVVPSYGEMDARLAYQLTRQLELSATGQNLLHARHAEYGFPGPTQPQIVRAVYGKLRWSF